MKKEILAGLLFLCFSFSSTAQDYEQYFDSDDTAWNSLLVEFDTSATGIWQIGPPQKTIFESASTVPNVLITDTVQTYPDSLNASASFYIPDLTSYVGAIAVQWNQKIDFDYNKDGGLVEFSSDSGLTWENALYSPNVYNYYGWSTSNEGMLPSGEPCFTGTDSVWRNVWLCFQIDYLYAIENLSIRFRIVSDSVETNQEGWMIDNLQAHETWFHPVAEQSSYDHFKIYPTLTERTVTIKQLHTAPDYKVTEVSLLDMKGQLIRIIPLDSEVEVMDVSDLPPGRYFIVIKANDTKEIHQLVIAH